MRLSWNEVRVRAAVFAVEWKDAAYEKGETQSFYNDFFHVFGIRRRSVARYEQHVAKLNNRSGFIDLFWPGELIVEQKIAGRDLKKAYGQAGDHHLHGLPMCAPAMSSRSCQTIGLQGSQTLAKCRILRICRSHLDPLARTVWRPRGSTLAASNDNHFQVIADIKHFPVHLLVHDPTGLCSCFRHHSVHNPDQRAI